MTTHAFEGDHFLAAKYTEIVNTFKPNLLIETGTHLGNTTKFLVQFKIPVLAIEKDQNFLNITKQNVGPCENLTLILGDSTTILEQNLDMLKTKKILAFLDAHWGGGMVLQRELKLIAQLPIKPFLIIHDFFNPLHPNYGFDVHDNIPYKFENYKELFEDIYKNNVKYSYNDQAAGAQQGVLFLEPL